MYCGIEIRGGRRKRASELKGMQENSRMNATSCPESAMDHFNEMIEAGGYIREWNQRSWAGVVVLWRGVLEAIQKFGDLGG